MEEGEVIMLAIRFNKGVYRVDLIDGTEVRRDSLLGAALVMAGEAEHLVREQMPDAELMEGVVH